MMKLVKVDWIDTFATVGWTDEPTDVVNMKSVGWLIRKDKRRVVLAGMIGSQGMSDYNSQQAIPRGCIISIKELAE